MKKMTASNRYAAALILMLLVLFVSSRTVAADELPKAQEHKDSRGNILRQEFIPAPSGAITVCLVLQSGAHPPVVVQSDKIQKMSENGYTIESFQYVDGVLDTIQNIPGDAQGYFQYGQKNGAWHETKAVFIGAEYSRNARGIAYCWIEKGKFEIKSWRYGSNPPDHVVTDLIEVLDQKLPEHFSPNAALKNGKPWNFKDQPAKPKPGADDRKNH